MPTTTGTLEHDDRTKNPSTEAERALIDALDRASGEVTVHDALADVRRRYQLGSFDAKEALWSLLGSRMIELTPRRTLVRLR